MILLSLVYDDFGTHAMDVALFTTVSKAKEYCAAKGHTLAKTDNLDESIGQYILTSHEVDPDPCK